jgi:esterase/lipase superfamily enzyme
MPHFRQIIMAAPDIDRREFTRVADAFQSAADHITLYAASNDKALGAAEVLHGDPRVGDAKPMFVRKGIDSVDASRIIQGFLKHSYFAEARLLDDIGRLLAGQQQVPRIGLIGIPDDLHAQYWRFQ